MFSIYFTEIKNRVVLVLVCWLFLFFVSYLHKEILLYLTVKPNINLNEKFYFIATNALEILNSYINLAYFISFQFTIYIMLFHIVSFVSPALYNLELSKLKNLISLSIFIWVMSNWVFHKLTLPVCWRFFISFQNKSMNFVNIFLELRIEKYLEMYYNIYYINIFLFQILLIFFLFLDKLPFLLTFVKKTRKIMYFLFIIVATFITPPDVLSQLFIFGFLTINYEIGIIILVLKNFWLIGQTIKT